MRLRKLWWWFRSRFLVLRGVSIGLRSYVGPTVAVQGCKNIKISDRVRIYPGARLETHNGGSIIIEPNVSIGQNFHVTSSEEPLVIGTGTLITGNVFVTNIDHSYEEIGVHIMQQPFIVRTTRIGENCFIGYGAAIQAGTVLGKHCVVGTNSVVRGEFPDYCVIAGAPARIIKRYNPESMQWERVK